MSSARLTSTGVIFPDSTVLNSRYGIVPQNSSSIFYQASSPIGWTKNTSYNGYTLRVVSSGGGSTGGNSSFTSVFTSYSGSSLTASISGNVESIALTDGQIPSHSHPMSGTNQRASGGGAIVGGTGQQATAPDTGSTGSGGSHSHPFSGSITYGYSFNIAIRYIDVILCSFT